MFDSEIEIGMKAIYKGNDFPDFVKEPITILDRVTRYDGQYLYLIEFTNVSQYKMHDGTRTNSKDKYSTKRYGPMSKSRITNAVGKDKQCHWIRSAFIMSTSTALTKELDKWM